MEDLNDFYYFSEVAQRGGFSAAARALKIPKSRLSRRISELEARLGARLLLRTTRQLHLTAIGEDFLHHCRAMVTEAQAAQELIERGIAEPRGRIRVACPVMLAQRQLAAMLRQFMDSYPKISVELEASNRRVDVVAEGFDVAIRARVPPLQDGDLVAKPLGIARRLLLASTELLARLGEPAEPEDLKRYPSLGLSAPDGRHVWRLSRKDGLKRDVEYRPQLVTDEMMLLHGAALAGQGIVQLPELVCQDDIRSGQLVRVLPDWSTAHDLIYAAYVSRRRNIPAVQAFLDFLGREVGPALPQLGQGDLGAA
ncbi:MAG: LysR family transcriptional regulator [Gammaproteobacteria bacterium]|nr:LysR family transcriptional regulator [Gammaproteobacteria bacterium]